MLAKHRLENHSFQIIRIFFISNKIAVDTQPVHIMVTQHFAFTNNRHIVFCMTGHNTGAATKTAFMSMLIPHLIPGCS